MAGQQNQAKGKKKTLPSAARRSSQKNHTAQPKSELEILSLAIKHEGFLEAALKAIILDEEGRLGTLTLYGNSETGRPGLVTHHREMVKVYPDKGKKEFHWQTQWVEGLASWVEASIGSAKKRDPKKYLSRLMMNYLDGYKNKLHDKKDLPYIRGGQMAAEFDYLHFPEEVGGRALMELEMEAAEGKAPWMKEVMALAGRELPVRESVPASHPETTAAS